MSAPLLGYYNHRAGTYDFRSSGWNWERLWRASKARLTQKSYSPSTIKLHYYVIRTFMTYLKRCHGHTAPCKVSAEIIKRYLYSISGSSASWVAANITVLRNVFDKIGYADVTAGLATPRRPHKLPEILTQNQVRLVINSAESLRDKLLISLIYSCGLKTSEACDLKWENIDVEASVINVNGRGIPLPARLISVLKEGKCRCQPDQWMFTGYRMGNRLSTRMAALIISNAATSANLGKAVTAMTLRHTFAVHALESGANIRQLQYMLGHTDIETTLIYQRMILPADAISPIDRDDDSALPTDLKACGMEFPLKPIDLITSTRYFWHSMKAMIKSFARHNDTQ